MTASIRIELRSPDLGRRPHEVVVTLPTFRRPEHLALTLASLEAQKTDRSFAVVVMENDAEGREGLAAARPFFGPGRLDGLVLVAADRGNCSAYNAGWSTALSEFPEMRRLLVIDDDEVAGETWVETLVRASEAFGADIVGAPQIPVFADEAGGRYRRHPVFRSHYGASGPVPILYSSGNVLIRREVLDAMGAPFLDPAFNFIGGGDSDFYSRCHARGFRFAWCGEAPVFETTPPRRTEFSWIQARSLRNGALSTIIERRRDGSLAGRLRSLLKSGALLAASPFRGLKLGVETRSAVIGLYPLQVAVGRFLGEFGLVNEQYRRPEQN